MPTLPEININKINSLIALIAGLPMQKAYRRLLSKPEVKDSVYYQLEYEINSTKNIERANEKLKDWEKSGISFVSISENLYPEKLKNICDAPLGLFILGNQENLKNLNASLAIVGSRIADNFGCELALQCGDYMAEMGVCIISGLAIGIDTFAHKGAIQSANGFPTIAVLGNGFPSVYPSSNQGLAKEIISKGGLIVSHFLPGTPAYPSNFLDRNRIIAGLSDATLVIQAPERSGSLSTARYALEEGRDVLAVPGAVNDPRYKGSNRLIKSGAHLICDKSDLKEFFPQAVPLKEDAYTSGEKLTSEQQKLVKRLKKDNKVHIDQLKIFFKDNSQLAAVLLELEIAGIVKQETGNFIRFIGG
jgi:DNA processing protein